jgi:hypothetical protein
MMLASPLLISAIVIEGYAVLAVELLAIRQLTPYVGNATDTVAIVIAADCCPSLLGMRRAAGPILFPAMSQVCAVSSPATC